MSGTDGRAESLIAPEELTAVPTTPELELARSLGMSLHVTGQAAARRTQNVLGGMACLAGGAQRHSRATLEAIGGRIDTTTLADRALLAP